MRRINKSLIELFVVIIVSCLFCQCASDSGIPPDQVIIGLDSEVHTLNPLFTNSEAEANISELIYLSLAGYNWNEEKGIVVAEPVLAKKWEWNKDTTSVLITLRDDIMWNDGEKFTAHDVLYSFDLYSDPEVQSRFFGILKNFYLKQDLSIDLEKSFEILDPYSIRINFAEGSNPSTYDFSLPILPKHIFEKIARTELATSSNNADVVGTGPYKINTWKKNQYLKLETNKRCTVYESPEVTDLVFKIISDYNARLTQLKKGDIDIMEYIRPEDIQDLVSGNEVKVISRRGREYDYLGLSNVDFSDHKKPHPLFGSPEIRKAVTLAINRELIVKDFLKNNGSLMITPVAPIFKNYMNSSLSSYMYNPNESKIILDKYGWRDSDGDGILDKTNFKFSFTICVPSGNNLREYSATIIQNNLKAVGIETKIEMMEPNILFEKMFNKELDAWIAGWSVPIPLDLKPYWHSNMDIGQANVCTYSNKQVDDILDRLDSRIEESERIKLLKQFQSLILSDQPSVFLFWIDNLVGFNKRIENLTVDPLATIQKCWKWKIK